VILAEFNSFGPAVDRLGSDSSRGAKVEAGGLSPLAPFTLTTAQSYVKVKVKISHTRYRALGPELIPVCVQAVSPEVT